MSEISEIQGKIAEVDYKLSELRAAKTTVSGVDLTIDSQMPGIDLLHVAGDKYDEQRYKEMDRIDEKREKLIQSYQKHTISEIDGAIGTLNQLKANLHVQLDAAIVREQVRQAQEEQRLRESMKRR